MKDEAKDNKIYQIMQFLGTIIEMRNLDRTNHIRNVGEIVRVIGYEFVKLYPKYNLTEEDIDVYVIASYLHDIGKIMIPDEILKKPVALNSMEYDMLKSHTNRGCSLLAQLKGFWDDRYQTAALNICKHHHERFDGSGYPDKLVGDNIPISAQLVSIADVYDNLLHENVYEPAHTKEEAFHMIVSGQCGMFSPKILECFRNVRVEIEEIESSARI